MEFQSKLLKENNFLFIYIPAFFSLLIFSLYFFQIGYFPISNFENLIALSLFVSFSFSILMITLVIPLYISNYIQYSLIENNQTATLLFGQKFQNLFFKITRKEKRKKIEFVIFKKLFIKMFSYHLGCFLLIMVAFNLLPLSIIITILLPILYLLFHPLVSYSTKIKSSFIAKFALKLYVICSFVLSNLSLIVSVNLLQILNENNGLIQTFSMYFCLLAYSIFALIPAQNLKINKFWAPMVLFFVITMLLGMDGSLLKIPKLIIQKFHIAENNATISTNKAGCELFATKGYEINCQEQKSIFLLPNINILWRSGELFLQFTDKNGNLHNMITSNNNLRIYDFDSTN